MHKILTPIFAIPLLVMAASGARAADPNLQDFTKVQRGRYLATVADCAACHTDPDQGRPFAGGRAIETPFGNVVSANITPDGETGIGNWSDAQFENAVRHGIRSDGSRLYPAMPYTYYTKMSHDDVSAIRAYLATVPAVKNKIVSDQLPFPLNIRLGMRAWNLLFFDAGPFKPQPDKSEKWNRGAYLVTGPAHCGACHTPKNVLGGDKTSEALRGSWIQGWFAPNLTNDTEKGLGAWSAADIVTFLKTGHNHITTATGPMGEVIAISTQHFTQSDLEAMATYLKDVGGNNDKTRTALASDDPHMQAGQAIYRDVCSACHALDGKGVASLFPSLAQSPVVRSDDPSSAIRVVLRGARSVTTKAEPTGPGMPSFAWQLKDDQVAAVLTYIRNSWGSAAPAVSADQVHDARDSLSARGD
jgi:mono/diheme cytochrome c family protein